MRVYPHKTPSILPYLAPHYTWKIPNVGNEIYLTFDDGPSPMITEWTLDLLASYDAIATFFMVGENVMKFPDIASRVLSSGHKIGNHSHTHLAGWGRSVEHYQQDVETAQTVFQKYLSLSPKLFRPPYGRILPGQGKAIRQYFDIIMWTYLSGDFENNLNTRHSVAALSKAKGGDILVFHDNQKYFENLQKVLPPILENLSRDGFSFVALPNPK